MSNYPSDKELIDRFDSLRLSAQKMVMSGDLSWDEYDELMECYNEWFTHPCRSGCDSPTCLVRGIARTHIKYFEGRLRNE